MSKLNSIMIAAVLFGLLAIPVIAAESLIQEHIITSSVMEFPDAWQKHNPKILAALWAPDGDLINPFGRVANGHDEIEKLFSDEHAGAMKASHFELKVTSVKMLGRTVAIVDGDAHVTGVVSEGKPLAPMDHHLTFILHKVSGDWKYAAVRAFGFVPKP